MSNFTLATPAPSCPRFLCFSMSKCMRFKPKKWVPYLGMVSMGRERQQQNPTSDMLLTFICTPFLQGTSPNSTQEASKAEALQSRTHDQCLLPWPPSWIACFATTGSPLFKCQMTELQAKKDAGSRDKEMPLLKYSKGSGVCCLYDMFSNTHSCIYLQKSSKSEEPPSQTSPEWPHDIPSFNSSVFSTTCRPQQQENWSQTLAGSGPAPPSFSHPSFPSYPLGRRYPNLHASPHWLLD